KVLSKIF
nr:Chain C, Arf6 peptide [Homo sapiens]